MQCFNFVSELSDNSSIRVLINNSMVYNSLGSVSIAQTGQGFLVVVCRWADGCYHHSFTVPSQIILQEHIQDKNQTLLIRASSCQNQQNDLCAQRRLLSAWAPTQSDQGLRCPHEEILGSQPPIECTAKTPIRLGGCPS